MPLLSDVERTPRTGPALLQRSVSLSDVAFDIELENGVHQRADQSVLHSAWTEREAKEAQESASWSWSCEDEEGGYEGNGGRWSSTAGVKVAGSPPRSYQSVLEALFDFEDMPPRCSELS